MADNLEPEELESEETASADLQAALRVAKRLKGAVSNDSADVEAHSFDDDEIGGQRNVSVNAGCSCA